MGRARRAARRLLTPVQRFLQIEAAGGIVLLCATALAVAWANSPWRGAYGSAVAASHLWIDDGLMTVFFFVIGLEIRRELDGGELRGVRRATPPIVSALGGMLAAAAIFSICNSGRAGAAGWGIPMSTDVAFAAGVLTLLGARVAPASRVVMLARAVSDDVLTIIVIAVFYAANVDAVWLGLAALGCAALAAMRLRGVRGWAWYVLPAAALWLGFYRGGVHPTLAGVVVGLSTPPVRAARVQRALHPWVAFGIMPLFALANAGVDVGAARLGGDAGFLFVGVAAGLAIGKPLGVWLAGWMVTRIPAFQPEQPPDRSMAVVGLASGIGFTVGLFVAKLAFPPGPLVATATLGLLVGSAVAMLLTLGIGSLTLRSWRSPR